MRVSYTSCATALRRFEFRDGNLGLTAKELRLMHLDRRPVADIEPLRDAGQEIAEKQR